MAARARGGVSTAARPRRPQGRALAPLVRRFNLPRAGVRGAHRRRRDGSRPAPLRDVRRSLRVLHPRRVGGRPDLPRDLRLLGSAVRDSTRSTSGSRCSSRTSSATCPEDLARGRVYIPQEDLRRTGARKRTWRENQRGRRRRALGGGQGAAAAAGGPRARLLRARGGRRFRAADAQRLAAAEIMGAIYRAHSRIASSAADYDVFTRVVRIPRPRRALIAATTWARTADRRARAGPPVDRLKQ